MSRRPLTWTLATLVVLVIAMVTACSNRAASYASASDLAAALTLAEIDCATPRSRPAATLVASQATCGRAGSALELYVFDDEAQRDRWLLVGARLGPVAVGPNWTIQGDAGAAQGAAAALHGRFDAQG